MKTIYSIYYDNGESFSDSTTFTLNQYFTSLEKAKEFLSFLVIYLKQKFSYTALDTKIVNDGKKLLLSFNGRDFHEDASEQYEILEVTLYEEDDNLLPITFA